MASDEIKKKKPLEDSKDCYQILFENSHTIKLIIDPLDGSVCDANHAACEYYGWKHEQMLSMNIDDINTVPAAKRKNFHFRHRKADATIHDVEVHSGPIEINGKHFLLSLVYDLSEKMSLLGEREELSNRLSHYLANSPTITFSVRFDNGQDQWQWISENVEALLGYTINEVMKPGWWFNNLHPDDRTRILGSFSQFAQSNELSLEYRFFRKNRIFLWLRDERSWTTSLTGENEIVGTLTNISDVKQVEEDLILKSSALKVSPNMVIIGDTDGCIKWVNDAFEQFTGYLLGDIFGKNATELLFSNQREIRPFDNVLKKILLGETWKGELVYVKKTGSRCLIDLAISPVPGWNGKISNFIAMCTDITERKNAEAELVKLKLLLQSRIENPDSMIILSIETELRSGSCG